MAAQRDLLSSQRVNASAAIFKDIVTLCWESYEDRKLHPADMAHFIFNGARCLGDNSKDLFLRSNLGLFTTVAQTVAIKPELMFHVHHLLDFMRHTDGIRNVVSISPEYTLASNIPTVLFAFHREGQDSIIFENSWGPMNRREIRTDIERWHSGYKEQKKMLKIFRLFISGFSAAKGRSTYSWNIKVRWENAVNNANGLGMDHNTPSPQSGVALAYILIAVALFAALSVAVANMMRGGGEDVAGQEKARIIAQEVIDTARAMRQAVQGVRISGTCTDEEISFDNATVAGYAHATRDACKIFDPAGAAMNWPIPADNANDSSPYVFTDAPVADIPDSGDGDPDLMIVLPHVNAQICTQINKLAKVNTAGSYAPPQENDNQSTLGSDKFAGAASYTTVSAEIGGAQLAGKRDACFESQGSGVYFYYGVLLAR